MSRITSALSLLALLALPSCAALSKKECLSMNWGDGGYTDGVEGKNFDTFNTFSEVCHNHGITADRQRYLKGREAGLKVFCTNENGLKYGRNGQIYHNVCPKQLEGPFLKGYKAGKLQYEFDKRKQELRQKEEQLRLKEIELEQRERSL